MFVSIGQAALMIGVSVSTLRRWEVEERFIPTFRTKGGHRRYDVDHIRSDFFELAAEGDCRETICYARVSSSDQRDDLERQKQALEDYCSAEGLDFSIIADLGSGINYEKRGLSKLLKALCQGKVARLVMTHRDRLLRFGSPLIFKICEAFGTEVVMIHEEDTNSFEEEVVRDVLEIMTVYSAKIYGRRSHQNRKRAA